MYNGWRMTGGPSGTALNSSSNWPLMNTPVGSGGILNVTEQLKVKKVPAVMDTPPDGEIATSGTECRYLKPYINKQHD